MFHCNFFKLFADDDNTEDHDKDNNGDDGAVSSLPFVGRTSYFQRFSQTRLSNRERSTTAKNKSKSVSHKPSPAAITPVVDSNQGSNQGPQRQLCQDCKEMVLQVVRAQSTARRLQFAKSLFQQQTDEESTTKA